MPLNEILAILMLASFFVLLMAGIPVALTLATAGLVFGYIGFGPLLFNLLPNRIYGVVTNYTLIAVPLFVFMGVMLEKSRLAEDLMEVISHAAGGVRGGLGISIIVVGVLMGPRPASSARRWLRLASSRFRRRCAANTTRGWRAGSSALPARSADHSAEPHPDPAHDILNRSGQHAVRRAR
jgi:hypothetical protein